MIDLYTMEETFAYDLYHITKAFFPEEEFRQHVEAKQGMLVVIEKEGERLLSIGPEELDGLVEKKEKKMRINHRIYKALVDYQGNGLSWGILTGIRPTKVVMKQLEEGKTEKEIETLLSDTYLLNQDKIRLCMEVAEKEKTLLEKLDYQNGYSLYIGIPFCPTTCVYCSFTSYPLFKWKDRIQEYLNAVYKELEYISRVSKDKKLNTIYVGGGTPTTLSAEQLDELLSKLETLFSYEELLEITVEAGRPDSITREKLEVLKKHHISRISINPQTMQQKTLDAIGRRHTVEQVKEAYQMARELGFDHINMDLIAGLPGETLADMLDTLAEIEKMAPDSLTVHALALKRASKLYELQKESTAEVKKSQAKELEQMIDAARKSAAHMELVPYYMYRQKNIVGNFENVGYAKVDKAGIYNILIMEEKQSILAVGAGASTKIVRPNEEKQKIVRVENVKDVDEYITRIDEMIERKEEWLWR